MIYSYTFQIDPNKEDGLFSYVCNALELKKESVSDFMIRKKSIDARKKPVIIYNFTVTFKVNDSHLEKKIIKKGAKPWNGGKKYVFSGVAPMKTSPVIVGFGPAGMFAAYALAKAGLAPIVLERGSEMSKRIATVNDFHKGGSLNPNCNVQFGEGGAGTFSDGKLNTGIKDKFGRNEAVLRTFVDFGADLDITYDGRAHMGTDVIRKVVVNMREEIKNLGGTILFDTQFIRPEIKDGRVVGVVYRADSKEEFLPTDILILAIGHSSRDTYETLYNSGFSMEAKSFAVGFRVIHEADFINVSQYGNGYRQKYSSLPTAYYKLARTTSFDRNVYSFCMCPGGVVVNASSEEGMLCINGMSNKAREGKYSNAAIVMNVGPKDFEEAGFTGVLAGMEYQRKLEKSAYQLAQGRIPVQFYKSFQNNEIDTLKDDRFISMIKEGIIGNAAFANLRELFTENMNDAFIEGMQYFDTCIKGYESTNPLLAGVEARTSAPIRIVRGEDYQSLSAKGLYPCGEGAGYAGGIMSAAMDGLKVAEAIVGLKP